MARIIRDTSAFLPQSAAQQPQPGASKAPVAAGWLGLANAVVQSPILGALLRGGQAVKHAFEDRGAITAARRRGLQRKLGDIDGSIRAGQLGLQGSPDAQINAPEKLPELDARSGLTLGDEPRQSIFGAGTLGDDKPELGSGLSLAGERKHFGGEAPEIGMPTDEAPTNAVAPTGDARELDVEKGATPGGPPQISPPATVGLEPEPERKSTPVMLDDAWTTQERLAAMTAAADRRLGTPPRAAPVLPIATDTPPAPPIVGTRDEETEAPAPAAVPMTLPAPPPEDLVIPPPSEVYRDTARDTLGFANDPALVGIKNRPDEVLRSAVAALGRQGGQRAEARAASIQTELDRRSADRVDAFGQEQAAEDDAALAEAIPLEVAELWASARGADTPEKQAQVLRDVQRARVPISSLADLVSGQPQQQLMAEARSLFPQAPRKSEAQLAVELALKGAQAERYREQAETDRRIRDELEARTGAQGRQAGAKAETEEALRNEREETERSRSDKNKGQANLARGRADALKRMQDINFDLATAKLKAYGDQAKAAAVKLKKLSAAAKVGLSPDRSAKLQKALVDEMAAWTALRKKNSDELDPQRKQLADLRIEEQSLESQIRTAERVEAPNTEGPRKPIPTGNREIDSREQLAWRKEVVDWNKEINEARNADADKIANGKALELLRTKREKATNEIRVADESADAEISEPLRQAAQALAKLRGRTIGPPRVLPGAAPVGVTRPTTGAPPSAKEALP